MKMFQVKEDCETLLNRFQQTESVRFEAFSKIWKELHFEQIFYGLVNHEKRRFSRLVLDAAYPFLLPPFSFQIRVGGLYLLYALFTCQTAAPPQQIRLALKDWEEVMRFEQDSIDAQHYDVVYVLKKLIHQKAFFFTAMPRLLVFEKKRKMERAQFSEGFMERPSAPQTLLSHSLLEELSNVHGLYENLKSSLSVSDSSVNLTHKNLLQKLQSSVLDFHHWQQDKDRSSPVEDSGEGSSTQQESSRRADLLASIKSRAYGQATEVCKSRRHRVVEVDVSKPAASSGSSRYHREKQRTLKYRTTASLKVSGDTWKDASSSTHISHLTTLDSHEMPKPPRGYKKFKWKTEED